ncbi:hypothetical protein NQ315_001501 [Exocentrus adspersus]|uniref:Peptidase S1 domain-containing protein n=1 Tax=Exocentrus adspersus TaxID=1586481 RepID=A0AAV8WA72_9CUCU|nr:hypothetical protein NQ315_001501 [Exocentrus adspersus]
MKPALLCLSVLFAGIYAASPSLDAPSGRILGGRNAAKGQLPYQVSIQYCLNSNSCQHSCGGAIIDPNWIISAAHCITQAPALGSYQIVAGVTDLKDESETPQTIRISYVFIHPNYEGGINPHDIALFRLSEPLDLNNQVAVINLPDADEEYTGTARISGWGSTGGSETPVMPTNLQYVDTPTIPTTDCQTALDKVLGGLPHPLDLEGNICTGPLTGGVSICTGDSGGPVADAQGQKLIGITSWFVTPCGTVGAPSIHVKLSNYITWIKATAGID